MADGAPQMPKVGFRFQGFGSTSITAAIPQSQTIRPLPTHLDKKIHPRDWTFSPKPELTIAIKKTDATDLKPKPFKANPVPSSHYNKPYQTPKKSKTVMAKKLDAKKTDGTDLKPFKANPVLSTPKITKTEVDKKGDAPGLVNRMWHSMIDPILHPYNETSPEKVPLPDKKKNVDNFTSKKQFRAKPAPPSTQKPSIPVVPQKRLPVRNVKNIKHLDADEKAELQEFKLTEKATHQQVDAHKEIPPSHSLNKIGHGEEDVVQNADLPDHPGLASRIWQSMVDPILHTKKPEPDEKSIAGNEAEEKPDEKQTDVQDEASTEKVITSEPEKKESATGHSHPKLEETAQPMAENADLPDHPGLASRIWHSMVDPILHKKQEPDEKSIAGNDAEGTLDEKKLDVQDEVLVEEDPQTPEADTSEKSDLDVELPSVPETHHVKKITKEIVLEAAVPDENEIAPNPEADLDPTREAVEISPFARIVKSRLETEAAAGTRKVRRRREKKRRHSENHLPRPQHSEEIHKKPEEPVRPGLLRRAVGGISSTALSAGRSVLFGVESVLSSVGSVVGLGRNRTSISIPEEPAAKTDKKHRHHKKKSHQKRTEKDL
jgi:hypothetical protein